MRDNTVNESNRRYPENITERHADITDKIKFPFFACGKKSERHKMDAKPNKSKPSISLIDSLRENGQIIEDNDAYVAIKAYPGGNPNKDNKAKRSEDRIH